MKDTNAPLSTLCPRFRNRCSETILYLGYLAVFSGSPGGMTVDPSTPTEEKMVGRPLISGPITLIFLHGNHPASSYGEWSPLFHYPHLHSTLITSGVHLVIGDLVIGIELSIVIEFYCQSCPFSIYLPT